MILPKPTVPSHLQQQPPCISKPTQTNLIQTEPINVHFILTKAKFTLLVPEAYTYTLHYSLYGGATLKGPDRTKGNCYMGPIQSSEMNMQSTSDLTASAHQGVSLDVDRDARRRQFAVEGDILRKPET